MPTIKDVAKLAGVSVATVSRVINKSGEVSQILTTKVEDAMKELGYRTHLPARSLRIRRTRTLCFFNTDMGYLSEPYIITLAQGIQTSASNAGYSVVIRTSKHDRNQVEELQAIIEQRQFDGFIVAGILQNSRILPILQMKNIPFVLVGRRDPYVFCDFVGQTDFNGMYDATEYLINLGHKRIGYINREQKSTMALDRFSGYKAALKSHSIQFSSELVVYISDDPDACDYATERLISLKPPITAIIAAVDKLALRAWAYLLNNGIRVPQEMSLMGFGDIECASLGPLGLSTVNSPISQISERAVMLLIDRIEGKETAEQVQIIFPTKLAIRDTTSQPPTTDSCTNN